MVHLFESAWQFILDRIVQMTYWVVFIVFILFCWAGLVSVLGPVFGTIATIVLIGYLRR